MSEPYQTQLTAKSQKLQALFNEFQAPPLEIFDSPAEHYRLRAEFRVWHEGDDLYYIMFDQKTRQKYRVDTFPTASKLINDLMPNSLCTVSQIVNGLSASFCHLPSKPVFFITPIKIIRGAAPLAMETV